MGEPGDGSLPRLNSEGLAFLVNFRTGWVALHHILESMKTNRNFLPCFVFRDVRDVCVCALRN